MIPTPGSPQYPTAGSDAPGPTDDELALAAKRESMDAEYRQTALDAVQTLDEHIRLRVEGTQEVLIRRLAWAREAELPIAKTLDFAIRRLGEFLTATEIDYASPIKSVVNALKREAETHERGTVSHPVYMDRVLTITLSDGAKVEIQRIYNGGPYQTSLELREHHEATPVAGHLTVREVRAIIEALKETLR